MAKVTLVCGRICSGKTTYAKMLCRKNAALLSVDEIMLAVFGQHAGEMHDVYAERVKRHLRAKSLELIAAGVDVVLDWGFWRREERDAIKIFYAMQGAACELHFIDVADEEWQNRIQLRNQAVQEGRMDAYFIDENLAAKFASRFEMPQDDEIDIRIR